MTMLGFAGVFVVVAYVQPLLVRLGGFSEAAVSPILLLFGGGMIVGNIVGGRLADRWPTQSLLGTLFALAVVLHSPVAMPVFIGLLGVAAFATVSPLQLRVLRKAEGAGQNLASSFNIAFFNLGNAFGAWLGGMAIDRGPGLTALPWIAAVVTLTGLAIALVALRLDVRSKSPAAIVAATACR